MVTDGKTSEGQDTQQNLRRLRNLAVAGVVYRDRGVPAMDGSPRKGCFLCISRQ